MLSSLLLLLSLLEPLLELLELTSDEELLLPSSLLLRDRYDLFACDVLSDIFSFSILLSSAPPDLIFEFGLL
jgi:hypothetical protein